MSQRKMATAHHYLKPPLGWESQLIVCPLVCEINNPGLTRSRTSPWSLCWVLPHVQKDWEAIPYRQPEPLLASPLLWSFLVSRCGFSTGLLSPHSAWPNERLLHPWQPPQRQSCFWAADFPNWWPLLHQQDRPQVSSVYLLPYLPSRASLYLVLTYLWTSWWFRLPLLLLPVGLSPAASRSPAPTSSSVLNLLYTF